MSAYVGEMASDDDSGGLRAIVARAVARDADAWENLNRRGYVSMFAYARRRVASDEAADDAVSEAMTQALKKIDRFTWQGAGFDAWLYGILRNVVLEQHRRRGATRRRSPPSLVPPIPRRIRRRSWRGPSATASCAPSSPPSATTTASCSSCAWSRG